MTCVSAFEEGKTALRFFEADQSRSVLLRPC